MLLMIGWIALSVILFCIYSWICAYFSMQIICKCKEMTIIQRKNSEHDNNNNNNNNRIQIKQKQNPLSIFCITVLQTFLFLGCLFLYLLFLILPIGLYNIYHSLPTDNNLPFIHDLNNHLNINYDIISYIVENFASFIMALQQWFLITPGVSLLIDIFPFDTNEPQKKNKFLYYYKNLFIQFIRNFTFIIIPFLSLIIFDDKCFQHWKDFWPSCVAKNKNYLGGKYGCLQFSASFTMWRGEEGDANLCFYICEKIVFGHRCVRQIFQVLAPLYTIKATIALFFPFIYYIRKKLNVYFYQRGCYQQCQRDNNNTNNNCLCACCCKYVRKIFCDKNDNSVLSMDIEYIALISNLEILIVFGWGVPLLIPIYTVIIFGYSLVFLQFLKNEKYKFMIKDVMSLRIVGKWLIISIVIQQIFAFLFYFQTQVYYYCLFVVLNACGVFFYILLNMRRKNVVRSSL